MIEVWKDIFGYEGFYQVSNLGNIKGLDRVISGKRIKGKNIKPCLDKKGYLRFRFKGEKDQTKKIHRVVAETFLYNGYGKPQVNHKNGIKDDNRVENLEWTTASENIQHAFKNGLKVGLSKDKHAKSILTKNDVSHIRDEYDKLGRTKEAIETLAKGYKISKHTVRSLVMYKKHWTDIE